MTDVAPPRRRRGPIGRLDLETIVAAGLALAARPGVRAITVRELGVALKADPTAIYRHVDSKDGLLRLFLDRLTGIIREEAGETPDWREHLRRTAFVTLDVYLRHPAIGAEAMRLSSGGVNELRLVESMLQAFHDAGLDEAAAARHYAVLSVFVLSFCAGAASLRVRAEEEQPNGQWVDLPAEIDAAALPRVAASRDALAALTDVAAFRDGLELIIRAAEAEAGAGAVEFRETAS